KRRTDRCVQQRLHPLLLLPGGAEHRPRLHVARGRRIAVESDRGQLGAASGDLGQRGVLQVGQAAVFGMPGQEQVPQTTFARLGLQFTYHGSAGPGVLAFCELLLKHRLGRVDVFVHERQEPLSQLLGLGRVGEIHQSWSSLSMVWARSTSSGTIWPMVSKPAPTVSPWLYL